jgi:serine/threonine-protein kinase
MQQGDVVSERYELDRLLGRGGMGHVWRAHDTRLNRHVAVKVLATNLNDEPEALVRFFSEAQSIARISHPNVVTVLDFGEFDGVPYLVLEYVSGGDLTDIIGEPIYEARALGIMAASASAAGAAHKLGIVHRDIKASNILLTEDEKPKLADFGIAASSAGERLTQTGAAIGSPHYISPEQAKGRSATSQSDIYSLGIVLFELLTGRKPFEGANVTAIAIAHVEKEPPTPSSLVPGISRDIDDIVGTCLQKDQGDRFRDGESLARALHEAMEGAGGTVVGVTGGRRPAATALLGPGRGATGSREDALAYEEEPVASGRAQRASLWQRIARRSVVTAALSALVLAGVIVAGVLLVKGTPNSASAKPAHHHGGTKTHGHHKKPTPTPTIGSSAVPTSGAPAGTTNKKSSQDGSGGGRTAPANPPGTGTSGSGTSSTTSSGGGSSSGGTSGDGGTGTGGSGPTPAPTSSPVTTPAPTPSPTTTTDPTGTSSSQTSTSSTDSDATGAAAPTT